MKHHAITDPLPEHCAGKQSVMLANLLTRPLIVIVRCRGCGKEITERSMGNNVTELIDSAAEKWEEICKEEGEA